ncbi:MAG: hypothetical protein LBK60_00240 [Verrucomicrobiales bacterium]|jgi:peptidoglycan hydrolase CwlO-like protein|nr:hypothetical protein [Verrucomicrobiales bacterium]
MGKSQTIEEQLAAAQAELTNTQAQLTTVSGEKTALDGQLKAEQEAHTKTKGELATVSGERDTARAEVAKLQGEAKTAEVRAQEILAASGHPAPVAVTPAAPIAAKSKREEYAAITDPVAKARFWGAHKQDIISGK